MDRLTPQALPGTGLEVGPVVLGTMTFGTEIDEAQSAQIVHRARELGVTMFDCANSYAKGHSEEILGRALRTVRDEVQVATKVGAARSVEDPWAPRLDRSSILRACDASLARLGCDYIDLYYLHMPDPRTPIEESLGACQELVDRGKILNVGMSNYAAWQITEAVYLAERNNWKQIHVSQPMYNLLARRIEEEYTSCTEQLGISNLVYNPLAGGMLTGKHRHDVGPEKGTRFDRRENYVDRYWSKAQFEAIEQLRIIASDARLSLIDLSLRWLLSRPWVSGILVGVSSLDHLETNVHAANGPSPDDATVQAIDQLWRRLRGPAPGYNR